MARSRVIGDSTAVLFILDFLMPLSRSFQSTGRWRRRSAALIAGALVPLALRGQPGRATADPLTLGEVLAAARAQHPLVEAARARVRAARGGRTTAGSLPDPLLTYQVENARFPGGPALPAVDRETSVFATLPLEALFQRWPRVRRADDEVRAAEADLALARRQVALDAARAYFRVALAQLSVEGALELRAALDELVRYNRARVAEGSTAEGDLIRVQVERDRAAAVATLDRVELVRARAELAPFLGRPASAAGDALVVSALGDSSAAPEMEPVTDYLVRARARRPDLVAARARAAAAGAEATYQRTLTVRQLGATIGTKRVAGANTMLAGISVPLPLFDRNRGEIQRADAERSAVERELAWLERRADAEVAGAYESVRLLAAQSGELRGGFLARAEEARRVALAAYEEGAGTLLQVIDAARTLADARLTFYRTQFTWRQSLLELDAAVGDDPTSDVATNPNSDSPAPTGASPTTSHPASARP